MHLVGFTIEIYCDTRPYERQICPYGTVLYEGQGLICFYRLFIYQRVFNDGSPQYTPHVLPNVRAGS